MNINYKLLRRPTAALTALALVVGSAAPAMLGSQAFAAQAQERSITMSNATPSAANTTYKVSFKAKTAGLIQGVVVDFCDSSGSPLMGDANCPAPAGLSFGAGFANISGLDTTNGTWAASTINSGRSVVLSNASAATSTPADTAISFELTGVTNPSATGTFYARILTYSTAAGASAYTAGDTTGFIDFGGIAMTTTTPIQVTAKIMEALTFCVSGSSITTCSSGLTDPAVNLGDAVGTNYVLQTQNVYTGSAHTQLSTNALHGATVRVKTTSSTTCAGLSPDNGTTCTEIPAVGGTAALIGAGTAAFGMCVVPATANLTAAAPYDDATCSANNSTTKWALDDTSAISTYGDDLYSSAVAVSQENAQVNYGVRAKITTPAGIYTTTQSLIATSTF